MSSNKNSDDIDNEGTTTNSDDEVPNDEMVEEMDEEDEEEDEDEMEVDD